MVVENSSFFFLKQAEKPQKIEAKNQKVTSKASPKKPPIIYGAPFYEPQLFSKSSSSHISLKGVKLYLSKNILERLKKTENFPVVLSAWYKTK